MILLLGGTSEASALARLIASRGGLEALVSLAGRTASPTPPPLPHRIGGFGGVAGLHRYLVEHGIRAVIDATHPFAARIKANAAQACRDAGVPLLALTRPPWSSEPGDRWTCVSDASAALAALGEVPRRVLLTAGRLEVPAFVDDARHFYIVRSIDPPERLPPRADLVLDRGPFDEDAEIALMQHHRVDVLVTKNSGGAATYGKIAAARRLSLPVVLIERPQTPTVDSTADVEAAYAFALRHAG